MLPQLMIVVSLAIGQSQPSPPTVKRGAWQSPPEGVMPARTEEGIPSEDEETPTAPPTEEPTATPGRPDRWMFMRMMQGTWPGWLLDGNRMQLTGWVNSSFTASSSDRSNLPVVWNDRANDFLLNQAWFRFERSIVTSGTTTPTWGFRSDWLVGSDYRYTLARGVFNGQLTANDGAPNLYGVDPIQFYANVYFPTWFQGTELRLGRHYCPFGVESLEAISTPLVSRSYAFNWAPPFTHTGIMVNATLTPTWSVNLMLVEGNDVFIDPADELRFVGKVQWTSPDKRQSIAFGTSAGRGKYDADRAFNHINVFDVVYTRNVNARLVYNFETIYGYQTDAPRPNDGTVGTVNWWSVVNYLFYSLSPRLTAIARSECFDDVQGSRTGFEGLYLANTVGIAFKPYKSVILRSEIRYDHNIDSRPFEDKRGQFTAGFDAIVRW